MGSEFSILREALWRVPCHLVESQPADIQLGIKNVCWYGVQHSAIVSILQDPAALGSIPSVPKSISEEQNWRCWGYSMALVRWKWKVAWKCSSNPACTGECHASSTKKLVLQKNVRWFSLLCYSGQSFGTPRLQNQMSLWLWLDLFVSLKQKGKMWPPLPIHQGQRSEWHWVWLGDPF